MSRKLFPSQAKARVIARCHNCGDETGTNGNCPVCGRLQPNQKLKSERLETEIGKTPQFKATTQYGPP